MRHRVKNDLALVRSLFSLQSSSTNNRETKRVLEEAEQRIRAIAEIYDLMYHGNGARTVMLDQALENIVENSRLGKATDSSVMSLDIEHIAVSDRFAMAVSLIVNELVTNSLKYGISPDGVVRISVSGRIVDEQDIVIVVRDEGSGFAERESSGPQGSGFGRMVIDTLVAQYHGSIERVSTGGAQATLRFSLTNSTS